MSQSIGAVEAVSSTAKYDSISRLSDQLVAGLLYHREVRTPAAGVGPSWNYMYSFDKRTGAKYIPNDDDGNYGNSHVGHGAALRYLRLHDADSVKLLDYAMEYTLSIEAAAVALWGPTFSGSFSYWAAPFAFTQNTQSTYPDYNHNYLPGEPRGLTSIDQMHMGAHWLYSYLYLLRNEPASITPRRQAALDFLDRAVVREATNYSASPNNLIYGNLQNKITAGVKGTPLNNGITDTFINSGAGTAMPTPFYGTEYTPWKVTGTDNRTANASSNVSVDDYFRGLLAPNTTPTGFVRYLKGACNDMLGLDFGRQTISYNTTALPLSLGQQAGTYPLGWEGWAATTGNLFRYTSGATPPDKVQLGSAGNRDTMSGRAAQRALVLALTAMLDPTYMVRVNESLGTTVNVLTACEDILHATALYLLDPDTGLIRQSYPGALGKSGSYSPDTSETPFAGYTLMACEAYLRAKAIQAGTATNPYV